MVKAKKQAKDKGKRKPTVKKETLKDLSVKEARKIRGGRVIITTVPACGGAKTLACL